MMEKRKCVGEVKKLEERGSGESWKFEGGNLRVTRLKFDTKGKGTCREGM